MSDAVSKDLEDGDGVWEDAQIQWNLQPIAEQAPLVPVGDISVCAGADHTIVYRLLCMVVAKLRFMARV
eukprot:15130236-Ditylum_brightwellii.AAC.1